MEQLQRIPKHVAIIMDGNGRWAELRGLPRHEGHAAGVEPVRRAIRAAVKKGVKYLTIYTFSTENWGRPAEEVEALMELFCRSVASETPELRSQGVEIRMIGDRTRFSQKVQEYLASAERETAGGQGRKRISATSCCGRPRMPNSGFPRCCGPTSRRRISTGRSTNMPAATAVTGW